ncbi:hypothetical protein [Wolbachia endosymbiont of Bemisia tabaci]|uniref:hypothetical protein n=1 Tax=Wolbachia endosymbiont of Bemisia tabaci TaxID=215173 RepID=UPI002102B02E|nr:hypothetical protein [Wolbachia endosymbiont of Bemisia tabaci]
MTIGCKKELSNCISRYREELAENKAAIRQTLTSDKINISDYFYQGDKICNKELFNIGSECQDTKYGSRQEYTYDEWKEKIEKPHAIDLQETLKGKDSQEALKGKILKSFEDYKKYYENATEAIKRELDIDSKLKAILKEKQQPETDETRAYHDVIRGLYENGDMRSQLKCNDLDCFNRTIEDNLSQKKSEL